MASLSNTVWIFNERIRALGESIYIPFESCGKTWTRMSDSGYASDITYTGQEGSVVAYDFNVGLGSWTNDAYRTIKIGTTSLTDDSDFGVWLKANARKTASKVVYGDTTIIDITDTTATEDDVAEGVVFYKADGTRSVGKMASGGLTYELLWTNPNINSNFSAQTVSLDLSSYKAVVIFSKNTTNSGSMNVSGLLPIGSGLSLIVGNAAASTMRYRTVIVKTTGIEFSTGYQYASYGSNASSGASHLIPAYIYGVK